jgi:oligo-1,6-glucosidase/alpha-glucosidase
LPFPTNAATHSLEVQHEDPTSILALYRRLLALRRATPALRSGELTLAPLERDIIRYERRDGDDRWTVLVNTSGEDRPWPSGLDSVDVVASSVGSPPDAVLRSLEAIVLHHR